MPIPWLTVLKVVPWSDVIANTPKVLEGARQLWSNVGGRPARDATGTAPRAHSDQTGPSGGDQSEQLANLETRLNQLDAQMRASSQLIDALAEQNAQLIRQVDSQTRRLIWLTRAAWLLSVVAIAALYRAWSG